MRGRGGVRGRGVCVAGGGMHGRGACVAGGCAWQGGRAWQGGCAWQGGVHVFIRLGGRAWFYSGGCMVLFGGGVRGFIWGGVCGFIRGGMRGFIRGGVHGFIRGGGMRVFFSFSGYNEIRSMSGRYASYWNAFLLSMILTQVGLLHFLGISKVSH